MKNVYYQALLGAFALMVLPVGTADAGIKFGVQNIIQYDNREIQTLGADEIAVTIGDPFLDPDGNGMAPTLNVGDRVEGVLQANAINAGGAQPVSPETTGVFDLTVAFVLAVGGNADGIGAGTVIDPAVAGGGYDGRAVVLFRPTNMGGGEGRLGAFAAGTALALYEGGPVDVQDALDAAGASPEPVFTAASDGALVGSFGFTTFASVSDWGTAGNGYWAAIVDYGSAASGLPVALPGGLASPIATFFYGLEALSGPIADVGGGPIPLFNAELIGEDDLGTGIAGATSIPLNLPFGTNKFDLVGTGTQRPNLDLFGAPTSAADQSKFPLFSQDPTNVHPSTPEPGSMILALLGAGCAAPFVRRRRRKSKESAA